MKTLNLEKLITTIQESTNTCGQVRVIAIDGPAGSGKTSLANTLAANLNDCQIIHLDDLYNGWNQDLVSELATRIRQQILQPLQQSQLAQYSKYDWHQGAFTQIVTVPKCSYLILEGVGAANPKLGEYFALTVWVQAPSELLLERLIQRDGLAYREQLINWQQHEAKYFDLMSVKSACDVVVSGD